MEAVAYCNRQLTNGHFAAENIHATRLSSLLRKLHDAGLLEACSGHGSQCQVIHDYLEYQPSRARVLFDREQTKEQVRRHRAGKVTPLQTTGEDRVQRPSAPGSGMPKRPSSFGNTVTEHDLEMESAGSSRFLTPPPSRTRKG